MGANNKPTCSYSRHYHSEYVGEINVECPDLPTHVVLERDDAGKWKRSMAFGNFCYACDFHVKEIFTDQPVGEKYTVRRLEPTNEQLGAEMRRRKSPVFPKIVKCVTCECSVEVENYSDMRKNLPTFILQARVPLLAFACPNNCGAVYLARTEQDLAGFEALNVVAIPKRVSSQEVDGTDG